MSHISDALANKQKELQQSASTPNKKNLFKVTKRSGEVVLFNEQKVRQSVAAALRAAGVDDNPISNQLVDEVIKKLAEELRYKDSISTVDIREAVEIAFLERGLTNAAQQYHDYPEEHGKPVAGTSVSTPEKQATSSVKQPMKTPFSVSDFMSFQEAATSSIAFKGFRDVAQKDASVKKVSTADTAKSTQAAVAVTTSPHPQPTKPPVYKELVEDKQALVHYFSVDAVTGYLVVCLHDSGLPSEVFVHSTIAEDSVRTLVELFTSMLSVALTHGVPLEALLRRVDGQLTLPLGSSNQVDTNAWNIIEHICSYLEKQFIT